MRILCGRINVLLILFLDFQVFFLFKICIGFRWNLTFVLASFAAPAPYLAGGASRTNSCCSTAVYRETKKQQSTYVLW